MIEILLGGEAHSIQGEQRVQRLEGIRDVQGLRTHGRKVESCIGPALWVSVLHPQAGKFTQGCGQTCVRLGLKRVVLGMTWAH